MASNRQLRGVNKKTPGGRASFKTKKTYSKHSCGICGSLLHGVPRGSAIQIKRLTKSRRRPSRPFGGVLCSACTMNIVSLRARLKFGLITEKDVPIGVKGYVL